MPPAAPTELKKPITPDVQLMSVRFSPCGTQLAAAAFDGSVRRWDVAGAEPTELPKITGYNGWVMAIAYHPDKKRLFAVDSWGKLAAWDYTAKEPKKLWEVAAAHDGFARKVAVSPDGSTVATCGRDGFVRLWKADGGAKVKEINGGDDLLAMTWHPTGKLLVTGDLHGNIKAWDITAGTATKTLDAKEFFHIDRVQDVGGVRVLLFDADGKTLYASGAKPKSGGFVEATPLLLSFDWASGKKSQVWTGSAPAEGYMLDLRWHPAGHLIAATSGQPGQGKVMFLKPGEAKPIFESSKANCHSVDVHPDGKRLAASATNANSSGNGKPKGQKGEYPGNNSPIYLWTLPA